MQRDPLIFVAGHRGLVGAAIVRALRNSGFQRLLVRTREELDLTQQAPVTEFFQRERPDIVFLAAAKVGGIYANSTQPADFLFQNLSIQNNVIEASRISGVSRFVFLGSSCVYPRDCPQPIKEAYLLSSGLEPTNRAYAVAKIAGIELCHAYKTQYGFSATCAMPPNLYGPGDNFDAFGSHVLPALVRKFVEAKRTGADRVTVWGTGRPLREFLHVDDLAQALVLLMRHEDPPALINIGPGTEVSIRQLAEMIAAAAGCEAEIEFDSSMPDGTPRKLLDCTQMARMGWKPTISLEAGIRQTVQDWANNAGRSGS